MTPNVLFLLLPVTPLSQYWNLQWHFELLQRISKAQSLDSGGLLSELQIHKDTSQAVLHLALRSVDRSETY